MTNTDKMTIIAGITAAHFRITTEQMFTRRRFREAVTARYFYYALCREYTGASLNDIGQTGRNDHATVLHGCRVVKDLVTWNGYKEDWRVLSMTVKDYFERNDERRLRGMMVLPRAFRQWMSVEKLT